MKKVLFATTALVASAGIASAQGVELSGSAEMGILGGDLLVAPDEIQFHTDIDVKFTLSGETDNGLTFGATIDLDEEGGFSNLNGGPESVFISGNFGTLTMGDTDGAFDWALQDLDLIADIADANTSHEGFYGNGGLDGVYDGQIARYEYSFASFAAAVSAEIDDTGAGDPAFGIGAKYSGDLGGIMLGVGVGYQDDGTNSVAGVSLDASLAFGLRAVVNYSDHSSNGLNPFDSHIGVGILYTTGAISVGANYGQFDGGGDPSGFGVAANYDLGGGAVIQAGYGSSDVAGTDGFSFGIAMSF